MEKPRQEYRDEHRFDHGVFSGESGERKEENHRENFYGNRYGSRRESCGGCSGCPYCRDNQKKSGSSALTVVAVFSVFTLLIAFLATLFCLLSLISRIEKPESKGMPQSKGTPYEGNAAEPDVQETQPGQPEIKIPKKQEPDGAASGEYYGDIRDAIRTDLKYSVEWENYTYEGNNDFIMIAVDYPVIKGDVPNIDVLNDVIAKEVEYFEEYYEEYSQYMLEGEIFAVYSEGSVTYMDEEVMSVVYTETVYTDYWQDTGLFCINIDMENGVVIDNSSIMDVNNDFAVDFRIRSREQNGTISALDYMTDQEIAYYLSDAGTAIVFYTPLGMEIGINYGESFVTVTYKDYDQFLKKY